MRTVPSLGKKLKELREAKDLSFRELAKKVRVSAPHLWDVENGKKDPSPELLKALAVALDARLEDLQQLDSRLPIDEMRKKRATDPRFGVALRHLIDSNISGEELDELVRRYIEGNDD